MTLQQLRYIVALDTYRHFVKAAESCFVAQPTLTLQVKKLEEEIGFYIFDRSVQPFIPTEMGEKFILKATQILREVDSLKEMVNQDKDELKGTFRLGIIPTLAPYLLPLFLRNFTQKHTEIHLQIKEMQSEKIIDDLLKNQLDIGLLATPLEENYIREVPLFYEPFLIYAHTEHSILKKENMEVENINEKGLWLLSQGHCFRNQILNLCSQKEDLCARESISFDSGSIETLKRMVQNHFGYTLIPQLAIEEKDTPFIKKFDSPEPVREISLVVHSNFIKEKLLNELKKSILEEIPNSFQKNTRFKMIKWR